MRTFLFLENLLDSIRFLGYNLGDVENDCSIRWVASMKTYTSRPTRSGMARKAWDYLQGLTKYPIEHMFYSRDHVDGQRWVAFHGNHGYSGYTGSASTPILGSNGIYTEVDSATLRNPTTVSVD